MNLLIEVKSLLEKNNLSPQKKFGQNFCVDQKVLTDMIVASRLKSQETILEIGPGFGFLTREILKAGQKVVAIEKDNNLISVLDELKREWPDLTLFNIDALDLSANFLDKIQPYSIVANLPYSISSKFFKKYLNILPQPQSVTVLVQKEVAERAAAPKGEMSVLSVSIQLYCQPSIYRVVNKESFWPQPEVKSAILRLDNIHGYDYSQRVPEKIFWQVVKCGFSSRRKMLQNNLASGLHLTKGQAQQLLDKSRLDPKIRSQDLAVADWVQLAQDYHLEFNNQTIV